MEASSLLLLLAIVVVVVFVALGKYRKDNNINSKKERKVVCVLGSGGHTTEMISLFATLDPTVFTPRSYVVASTDVGPNSSANKAMKFEQQFEPGKNNFRIITIPRSREVGQSWITTVFSTLNALVASFRIIWSERPDLVLCNGPGTCVPICIAAYFFKVLGLKHCFIIYSESFACVDHLSLSGRILYKMVDRFFVQWEELCTLYPSSSVKYVGRIQRNATNATIKTDSEKGYVLVTVGSTSFDPLIEAINTDLLMTLKRRGYKGIHVQYGRGTHIPAPDHSSIQGFEFQCFKFKDALNDEIRNSSLVISHAGAGSILETLGAQKPLIVVPNELLMNNHQIQLAKKLSQEGYLLYTRSSELPLRLEDLLDKVDSNTIKAFPSAESDRFAHYVDDLVRSK